MIDDVTVDEITQHLLRYGMTTLNVAASWLWPDLPRSDVDDRFVRLTRAGVLVRHPLIGAANYFVLSAKTSDSRGVRCPDRPFSADALVERYGVLLAAARRQCDVMTPEEFRRFFPGYLGADQRGLSLKNFFIDDSFEPHRVGWLLIDHDKDANRLASKARRRIDQIYRGGLPPFHDAILKGRLAITIVTATEGKKRNVEKILARKTPISTAILVEEHSELEPLFILGNR